MGYDKPDNYVEVNERIVEFRAKYPEGSLRQKSLEFRDVVTSDITPKKGVYEPVTKTLIVYTAQAFRSPDDPAPGEGTAAEFFPGKTPYTFDSEVQNAETAAWGRALIAVGAADAKKGLASAEEVRNRREADEADAEPEGPTLNEALARFAKAGGKKDQLLSDFDIDEVKDLKPDKATIEKIVALAIALEPK